MNYEAAAEVEDGSATPGGCTDPVACNYESVFSVDNGSCIYPEEGYDCSGACLQDSDGDGVCDAFEGGMYA